VTAGFLTVLVASRSCALARRFLKTPHASTDRNGVVRFDVHRRFGAHRRPGADRRPSRGPGAWLACAALAAACSGQTRGGVLLTFELAPGAPAPESIAVAWLDPAGRALGAYEAAVAEVGTLPRMFIEVDAPAPVERIGVASGRRAGSIVCEGLGRVRIAPAAQARLRITLTAGRLAGPGSGADGGADAAPAPASPAPADAPAEGAGSTDARQNPTAPPDAGAADAGAATPPADAVSGPGARADAPTSGPDARGDASPAIDTAIPFRARDGGPAGRVALLVRGANAGPNDTHIEARLVAHGFAVFDEPGTVITRNDAVGKALVVVSPAVSASDVNTKLRDVAVPVVVFEHALFPHMGMTGTAAGTHFGRAMGQAIAIANAGHPLAGGLMGTVMVSSVSGYVNWGVPAPSAAVVATLPGDGARAALFGYEADAAMAGLAAPARRVGFFAGTGVSANLEGNGLALLDAAIRWAAGD
jgi:hypothetical protein